MIQTLPSDIDIQKNGSEKTSTGLSQFETKDGGQFETKELR